MSAFGFRQRCARIAAQIGGQKGFGVRQDQLQVVFGMQLHAELRGLQIQPMAAMGMVVTEEMQVNTLSLGRC